MPHRPVGEVSRPASGSVPVMEKVVVIEEVEETEWFQGTGGYR